MNRKVKVSLISIISNSILILFKVIAGILSGSVSIISEAIHSSMDLIASLVAFYSVKESSKPADKDHPYGHGKIENISGIFEGILIFVAAGMIIFEAIKKITSPSSIEDVNIAIAVMLFSAFVNFLVSRKLYKVSQEEDSMALEADALHLKTDVYTALGVGLGILLIKITGVSILDPVVAILVSMLIIKEAFELCKNALGYLIDTKLPDEDEAKIKSIIEQNKDKFIDYHKLKTRKSGNMKHIDFHITVAPDLTVSEAHNIIAILKKEMCDSLKNTRVNIHLDPYKEDKVEDKQ